MGFEDDLNESRAHTMVSTESGDPHRVRNYGGFAPELSPVELARQRAGIDAYVETRKLADAAGVSTMALASRELAMNVVDGLDKATHEVLSGGFKGEKVQFLGKGTKNRVEVKLLTGGRLSGTVLQIGLAELREMPKIISKRMINGQR